MGRKSALKSAEKDIEMFFNSLPHHSLTYGELAQILSAKKYEWDLSQNTNTNTFIEFLIEELPFQKIILTSEDYTSLERYIWKNPTIYVIAQSIKKKAFLSHGSALVLHGLSDSPSDTVYINYEQTPKPQRGTLVQENIHRAFGGKQRESKLIYGYEDYKIIVINGKFTDRLGVESMTTEDSEMLPVTNIERTLIDIAVRPTYAGGVFQVLEAYKRAKDKVSVDLVLSMLSEINYIYPYHQVIGFYMERAGFVEDELSKLRELGLDFDFYIAHGLPKNKEFDSNWRLFHPKGM